MGDMGAPGVSDSVHQKWKLAAQLRLDRKVARPGRSGASGG